MTTGTEVRSGAPGVVQTRVTIPVGGMTCAACSARVQRTLEKSPGVTSASVNLMLENAVVDYDTSSTTAEALVERISKLQAALPER